MPLPDNLTQVRIGSDHWLDTEGNPLTGRVLSLTPARSRFVDTAAYAVIYGTPATATVDDSGAAWVIVPATDDPDIDPDFWNYGVVEPGGDQYWIIAPSASPVDPDSGFPQIQLSNVVPAPGPAQGVAQVIQGDNGLGILRGTTVPSNGLGVDGQVYIDTTHGKLYDKESGAWNAGLNLVGGGSGVTSVNGHAGVVVLTASDVDAVPTSSVGAHGGVASLDAGGNVPLSELGNVSGGGGNVASVNGHTGVVVLGPSDTGSVAVGDARLADARAPVTAFVTSRPVNVRYTGNTQADAIMDGTTHPLSTRFGSLGAAQAVFPGAVALTDEIDYWAIQTVLNTAPTVYLSYGKAVVHKSLIHKAGGNQTIAGEGPGSTILFLRSGSNSNVLSTPDQTVSCPNLTLRGFSVDGNNAGNTGTIGQIDNIHIARCDNLVVDSIESHHANGRGLHHNGLTGVVCTLQSWRHVYCHDNLHWGLHNSNGVRQVNYSDIICNSNGLRTDLSLTNTGNGADNFTGGFLLDHSEVVASDIICNLNGQDGLWFRNLFAGSVSDVTTNRNGRHGIRVLGFVNSYGNGWVSQGNGENVSLVGHDVWFDGTGTLNYGVTSRSLIEGILAGPNLAAAIATQGSWVGNEDYGIWFDDNMATGDLTASGRVYNGTVGDVRLPTTIGSLNWDGGGGGASGGGNPTDVTNVVVTPASVTDTSAGVKWSAATAVSPAKILNYTVYAMSINGSGDGVTPVSTLGVVTRADFTTNGGMTIINLTANTTYVVGVTATDTNGNESPDIVAADSFTTTGSQAPDNTAPLAPTGFNAPLVSATEIDLNWSPAVDPGTNASGVAYYTVFVNGTAVNDGSGNPLQITDINYAVTGLTPGTQYSFAVSATDNAGNPGNPSVSLVKTTTNTVARRDAAGAFITAGGALTVTGPATIQGGDLLMLVVSAPSGTTITPPTGFTLLPGTSATTAGTEVAAAYYLLDTAAAGTAGVNAGKVFTIGLSGSPQKSTTNLVIYSGVNSTSPIDAASVRGAPSAESDHTFNAVTTSANGTALVGFLAEKDAATNITSVTPSSGWNVSQGTGIPVSGIVGTGGASQQLSYTAFNPALLAPGPHGQNVHFVADQATANAVTFLAAIIPSGTPGADNTPPATVSGLLSSNLQATQVKLTWTQDTSSDTTKYNIYRATGTTVDKTGTKTVITGIGTVSTTMTGLAPSTQYSFAVSAVDGAGNESTALSNTVTVTTPTAPATQGILYGINASSSPLSGRNKAAGWVAPDGSVLVDATGASVNCGMTRIYYTPSQSLGTFSATKTVAGSGTNTFKRVEVCFKGNGGPTAQAVVGGAIDDDFLGFINSIPSGWEVAMTWHHEPNGEFNTTNFTPAQFKDAQIRLSRLLQGLSMPSGQPAKNSTKTVSLNSGVLCYIAPCYSLPYPTGTGNHGTQVQAALPLASELDPHSKVVWDAYQNPPPGGPPDLGTANQDKFTTPQTVWNGWWLSGGSLSASPLHSYGYDAAGHGYCIGEWMAPYAQNFTDSGGTHVARPGATDAQQATAIDGWLNFLEAPGNGFPAPYWIFIWEDPKSTTDAGAQWRQQAGNAARATFTKHASGPAARV